VTSPTACVVLLSVYGNQGNKRNKRNQIAITAAESRREPDGQRYWRYLRLHRTLRDTDTDTDTDIRRTGRFPPEPSERRTVLA
jgi:hypothetical protein